MIWRIFLVFLISYIFTGISLAQLSLTSHPELKGMISRALSAQDSADINETIDFHKEILKKQPKNIYSIISIATSYGKLGQFDNQIIWAKKAIAIDARYDDAYLNYGDGLLGLGKINEAKNAYTKALEINSSSSRAIYSLGLVADEQSNYLAAIEFYKKAVEIDPGFEKSYFNLASDYLYLKKYDDAVMTLNVLLNMNPNEENARALLSEIERKRIKQ